MTLRCCVRDAASRVAAIWLCFAVLAVPAVAKDLGTRGASWPIAEADLLTEIADRMTEMSESGEWARLESGAIEKARHSLEEPTPVAGIVPVLERRVRRFDPTITVAENLVGPNGEIIAAAGTRVNPLAHAPLTSALLFIDGRREVEVAWALAQAKSGNHSEAGSRTGVESTRIILLAGRPLELMRLHGRSFYFDLGGRLSARFGVRATPTRLVQDGRYLRLTEIPLLDGPEVSAPLPEPSNTNEPTNRRQPPC